MNAASSNNSAEDHDWFVFSPQQAIIQPSTNINISRVTHLTFDPFTRFIPESAWTNHFLLQHVRIPKTVKTVGKESFRNCPNLSSVDFQNGLVTIERLAFHHCTVLENITKLPDSLRVLGFGAFQCCYALTRVQLSSSSRLKVLEGSVFSECTALVEIIDLPEGLILIEVNAFWGCESLEKVKIPTTVKVIGKGAFENCKSLTLVDLPKALKRIQSKTFAGCELLSGVVLPSALEEIGYRAFQNCSSLQGVEFAKYSNVRIHPRAFGGCSSLVNVCVYGDGDNLLLKGAAKFARCMGNSSCMSSSSSVQENVDPFSDRDQLRGEDGSLRVRDRFADLPIHSLCYHASVTTVEQLKKALDDANSNAESIEWKDYLGMTPFHIIATSANPRVDLLECMLQYLLQKYATKMLSQKDIHGGTLVGYALRNARGSPVIQLAMRIVFSQVLLQKHVWHRRRQQRHRHVPPLDLNDRIESLAECVDRGSRLACMRELFGCVDFHIRKELTTILELTSWKRKMVEVLQKNETSSCRGGMDRETCRYQCGAQIVIENVIAYLSPSNQPEHLADARSAFPFLENTPL